MRMSVMSKIDELQNGVTVVLAIGIFIMLASLGSYEVG